MAIYDRDEDRIVVRIVYDGLGNAGKSTNLRELCNFFTLRRRSELYVPEEHDGRTLYFDWLQIESGLVGGYRLRCQVMSVPGQLVLGTRRARLLQTADVVVLVCESTPQGVERVKRGLQRTRDFVEQRVGSHVPFIVQANKQDLPGALTPEEVASLLGLDSSVPVVGARAVESVGVRETAVLAIRAAADRVQQTLLAQGLSALGDNVISPQDLYRELREAEESSTGGFALEALLDDGDLADPAAPPAASTVVPTPEVVALAVESRGDEVTPLPSEPQREALPFEPQRFEQQLRPANWPSVPTDANLIPAGLVWPSATGRELIRRLALHTHKPRLDLIGQRGDSDGSGKEGLILYEAEGFCLKTSQSRSFPTVDGARSALVQLVQLKQSLGELAPADTVLVVAQDDGTFWVWTISPWVRTLRARMNDAMLQGDQEQLALALEDFAEAAVLALSTFLDQNMTLDLHPSNFAVDARGLVYLDDEVVRGGTAYPLIHAVMQRVEETCKVAPATKRFVQTLCSKIESTLDAAAIRRADLIQHLLDCRPRTALSEPYHELILACVRRIVAARSPDLFAAPAQSPFQARELAQPFVLVPSIAPRLDAKVSVRPEGTRPGAMEVSFAPAEKTLEYNMPSVRPAQQESDDSPESEAAQTLRAPPREAPSFGDEPPALEGAQAHLAAADGLEVAPADSVFMPRRPTLRPDNDVVESLVPVTVPEVELRVVPESLRPPLPQTVDDLPSGYIWPGAVGRELIRRIVAAEPRRRAAGSAEEVAEYEAESYVLRTSRSHRFADADEGRAELLQQARSHVSRGKPADGQTVLMLVPSRDDGSHWLWTIAKSETNLADS